MDRFAFVLAPLLALALTSPARANISGGSNPATDCYAEWGGVDGTGTALSCTDGDPSCDADGTANGSCTINVSICALQSDVTACTPTGPLTKLKRVGAPFKTRKIPAPDLSAAGCGSPRSFVLKLRGKNKDKPSKAVKLKMVAVGSGGKDVNTLKLTCVKTGGNTGGSMCADNPAGGPKQLTLTSIQLGTDLDNGWTGTSHDFPVVVGSSLTMCLTNCNLTDDTVCDGSGPVGAGTANGSTFGAPLPLFAAGTPVCVINRFNLAAGPITGSDNLVTGEVTGDVHLLADVYQSDDPGNVCVRCQASGGIGSSGTCSAGPDAGKACTVEGTDFVSDSTGDKNYKLSRSCRPSGSLVGTLDIVLPLTTGTSEITGSKPCTAKPGEPTGVPVKDDKCQENGGTCTGTCTCDHMDTAGNCIDAKGGVRQVCCSNDPTRSCFPTAPGTAGKITRTGFPAVPQPPLPDPTFPKTANILQAAVFCEAATAESNVINNLTGLPGPAALLLPSAAVYTK
jgi:hypothetical protein